MDSEGPVSATEDKYITPSSNNQDMSTANASESPSGPSTTYPSAHWGPVFDVIEEPPETYQDSSPYNPEVYNSTGYGDEPYVYFDGAPGKDDRFTIDLEGGSTDQ